MFNEDNKQINKQINNTNNHKNNDQFELGKIKRLLLIKKDSRFAMFSDKFHSLKIIRVPISEIKNIDQLSTGDYLSLFIYKDNNNYLKATTNFPPAIKNEIITGIVSEIEQEGVFITWNWHEALWIPQENLDFRPKIGQKLVAKLELDPDNQQLIGQAKAESISYKFMRKFRNSEINIDQHAFIRAIDITENTITALIDDKYLGVIDLTSMPIKPEIGEIGFGKIVGTTQETGNKNKDRDESRSGTGDRDRDRDRDENIDGDRLIVQLQANMDKLADKVQEQILTELNNPKAHGKIPFNDNTNSNLILNHFGVSKKIFKRAIGGLLKQKKIKQTDNGIVRM